MTFSFSHDGRVWKTKYSYDADGFATSESDFISFNDSGSLAWRHNSLEAPINNFYGEQHSSKFTVVANNNPSVEKAFQTVGMECLQNVFSVEIEARYDVSTGKKQQTSIENMVKKEGNVYAYIPKSKSISTSNAFIAFQPYISESNQGVGGEYFSGPISFDSIVESIVDGNEYYKIAFYIDGSIKTVNSSFQIVELNDVSEIWQESGIYMQSYTSNACTITPIPWEVASQVIGGHAILASNPSINGDDIRGKYAKIEIKQKQGDVPFEVYCVNVGYTQSKLDSAL